MNDQGGEVRVSFRSTPNGVRIGDALEGEHFVVETGEEPSLSPALTDVFPFPVDRAVSFETDELRIPSYSNVDVRTGDGGYVSNLVEPESFPRDTYCVEISATVKTYLRVVDTAVDATGMASDGPVRLSFDDRTVVTVGARSLHTVPEATTTVSDAPADLMAAVSVLGSSIKEFSAERSWPTLRGHPPRIQAGDELHVPDHLERPDTGVRITVPETVADVYRVAPLAFYLGARVEPGEKPAIHLDNAYVEPLPADGRELERRVGELVRRFVLLDSLVRMDGYVPSDRHEYAELGPELSFYPPELYGASISEQVIEYLEVDWSLLEPYVPEPPTTAVLRPTVEDAPLVPHLVHALAGVHVVDGADAPVGVATGSPAAERAIDVSVPLEAAPSGAFRMVAAGYENRFDRTRTAEGAMNVAIAVDDAHRAARLRKHLVDAGSLSGVENVRVMVSPSCRTLEATLADPSVDVVYHALPTDESRIRCDDGWLDVSALELIGPALVATEGRSGLGVAEAAVTGGALVAPLVDRHLSIDRLSTYIQLLGHAVTVTEAASLSSIQTEVRVRYAGDPAARVVSPDQGVTKAISRYDPVTVDEYDLSNGLAASIEARIGMEYGAIASGIEERPHLVGGVRTRHRDVPIDVVHDSVDDSTLISTVDGVPLFPGTSEDDVRQLAADALADSARREADD